MTVKMPSLLKAENRAKLAIHGLKTIKKIQNEVISEADKAIGDVYNANFERKINIRNIRTLESHEVPPKENPWKHFSPCGEKRPAGVD